MTPAPKRDVCKYDELEWRVRIEERIWHSSDSLSRQVTALKEEVSILKEQRTADKKQQDDLRQFVRAYLPLLLTALVTGISAIIEYVSRHYLP